MESEKKDIDLRLERHDYKMKKLLFICFFAICGCLGFCPDSQAKMLIKNQKAGPHCTWSLSEDGVMTIRGKGRVKLQSNLAWANKGNVKQVIIQKGITGIGEYAFGNYDNLTEIKLPKTVNKLEEEAFAYCDNLVYITLSPNIKVLPKGAFKECKSLKKVIFPKKLKVIKQYAFSGCSNMEKLEIPDSVEKMDRQAIYNCRLLRSVTFPKKLKSKENLIEKCYSLRKVCNHSCLKIPLDTAKGHRVWRSKGKIIKMLAPKSTAKSLGTRYKLTYDLRGGTAKEELPQYRYYGDKTPLPEAEKEGYRFVGWRDVSEWSWKDNFVCYSEKNLHLTAYYFRFSITAEKGRKLIYKFEDDNFYMIDLGEKRYLTYCVRLSCDGGKTWVFTNGGDGYGNGGEYIVRNLNEKTEYVYEIAYSPRGEPFDDGGLAEWHFRGTVQVIP